MPAVVTGRPGGMDLLLGGLAGVFQGQVQGEEFKAQAYEFDEKLKLEREKFDESKIQWDEDMEHRYSTLRQMALDNRLTREQQERFTQMVDLREREMQKAGFDFQVGVMNPHEYALAKMQDDTTRQNIYETNKTQRSGDWLRHQQAMTDLNRQAQELQSSDGWLLDQTEKVLGGRNVNVMTPEEFTAARDQLVEQMLGRSRLAGAGGVQKPPASEVAATAALAEDQMRNYPTYYQKYIDKNRDIAVARSVERNGYGGRGGGIRGAAEPGELYFKKDYFIETEKGGQVLYSQVNGVQPLDEAQYSYNDLGRQAEIRQVILQAMMEAQGTPSLDAMDDVVAARYEHKINKIMSQMNDKSIAHQEYWLSNLHYVLQPYFSESPDFALPEKAVPIGPTGAKER